MIEIYGITISLAILLFLLTSGDRNSRLNRLFIRLVLCNIINISLTFGSHFLDGTGWVFTIYAVTFLSCVSTNLLIPLLADYIHALIAQKTQISRAIPRLIYAFFLIWLSSLMVSQFNGMYYYFDENLQYRFGEYFWMFQLFPAISLPIITVLVLRYRKNLVKSDILFLLIFPVFSIIAVSFQVFVNNELNLIYFSNSFFALFCYGGIQAQQAKLLNEKELELSNARVSVMLSQIQPHFLYNALVVIRHLCRTDPKLAEETVVEFSDYLRGNLDSLSFNELIPFEKELHHVETYLNIEKKRFGDKLKIKYDVKTKKFMVPVLALQPIVENAVRYGVTKKENGGTVEIKTEETENSFLITVTDDGAGFRLPADMQDGISGSDKRSHIGIKNTRSRLASMCGGLLEIQSKPEEGTTAVITIPKYKKTGNRKYEQ